MFNSKLFIIACSIVAIHTAAGYSDLTNPLGYQQDVGQLDQASQSRAALAAIIQNHSADMSSPLTDQEIDTLDYFANNSIDDSYTPLTTTEKIKLSQLISLNSDSFDSSTMDKFYMDQKFAANMNTQEIRSLSRIMDGIKNGDALSSKQVSDLKGFMKIIAKSPSSFIPELSQLNQYATLNQDIFSDSDIETLRAASRTASGISSAQNKLLLAIADRDTKQLNRDDIIVLQDLARKAPIGSLSGLSPETAIALNQIFNDNKDSFQSRSIKNFNTAFKKNQAFQFYNSQNAQAPTQQRPTMSPKTPNGAPSQPKLQQRPARQGSTPVRP